MPDIKIVDNGLFDEIGRRNAHLNYNKLEHQHSETDKRWVEILNHFKNEHISYKNLVILFEFTLCCPGTNAAVERAFFQLFGLAIHQNDHQARRRFVEWAQNEIAVVPDFHKRILFSDEAHFWLNGYVNKQNCRIWSEANPQVYVETPLHREKLTVWCALWAGGILLQKR
ncbi:uncharacterized protein TNCV_4343781 [Trichonephila clavipes]|nr:uncharacterized protein TNCV_4343781 [Trichonephila clavipes]